MRVCPSPWAQFMACMHHRGNSGKVETHPFTKGRGSQSCMFVWTGWIYVQTNTHFNPVCYILRSASRGWIDPAEQLCDTQTQSRGCIMEYVHAACT